MVDFVNLKDDIDHAKKELLPEIEAIIERRLNQFKLDIQEVLDGFLDRLNGIKLSIPDK